MATGTIKSQGLKSDTYSGTTDVGGDVALGINKSSGKIVVSVSDRTGSSYMIIPRTVSNGDWYAHYEKYAGGNWVPATGATAAGTYYYLDA